MKPGRIGLLTAALAGLTLLRLDVAAVTPLAPDEAYYWVWSRALAPGYIDHPPMAALWIRAGTWLAGENALGVRLFGPLSAALGSVLLADAGERLLPGRSAGIIAAALLNATLVFGIGTVVMTPDVPLLFFWTAALWAMARLIASGEGAWLLAAGAFAGLALDSKYTAVFLGLGIGIGLLAPALRCLWRTRYPWLAGIIALALFAPVLIWNAEHGWASFARQGGRTGAWQPGRALQFLGELIGGQVGLATPLVFLLLAGGIVDAARRAWRGRAAGPMLVAGLTVPPLLIFLQHALGDRVQGNWPAILYPSAAIAAGGLDGRFWQRLRVPAIALGLLITLAVYVQATFAPVSIRGVVDPTALRLAGWDELAGSLDAIRREQGASFIAADGYEIASELAWTLPPGVGVVGIDPRWLLFRLPSPALAGRAGLLLRSMRRGDDIDRTPWSAMEEIGRVARTREGETVEQFRLFRVVGRAGPVDGAVLPRP